MAGNQADIAALRPGGAGAGEKPRSRTTLPAMAIALVYGLAMVLVLAFTHRLGGNDYVGADNDDVMRLVEVRDLLNGQGWFDMTQYRLGLAGGTLMHWSRFIDLPIAALIRLFALFAGPQRAEQLALAVWPLTLAFAIVGLMGLAALRAGGRLAMHVACGMTILYVYGMGRFGMGSIDHHNAQLTLAALVVAMLADPLRRPSNFAIAGAAAAMGVSIGAESAPFVAGACMVVSLLWAYEGQALARQAAAFSLALVMTVTAAFFLTTPPHLYGMVTCDNLSLGFYALASIGGFLVFLSSLAVTRFGRPARFGALVATGVAVLGAAKLIAPHCLGNPLAGLDPMLTELWLSKVIEARSFSAQLAAQPSTVGGFYAVGLLAIAVCVWRLIRRERPALHFTWLVLTGISFVVSLVQVRGAMFSNLLSILPMGLMIADLRDWQRQRPDSVVRAVAYFGAIVASLPLLWSVAGLVMSKGMRGLSAQLATPAPAGGFACATAEALAPLAALPAGVVMAPSDLGVHILRYTQHRVLSAPYHRDQGGMLTELNAGLALPSEAIAFLKGAGVDYLLFCPGEVQTRALAQMKPDGFYAALMRGQVPGYLEPMANPGDTGLQIFRVRGG